MTNRRATLVAAAVLTAALGGAGCSSSDDSGPETTTTSADVAGSSTTISGVVGPVVLTPADPTTTVTVGRVVTFDMGDPGDGSYVAVSADPAVFRVDGEGRTEGTFTTNAGGTAVGAGTTEVSVSFQGAADGVGTPTVFTVTVG